MIQEILIGLIFLAAVIYIGRLVYRSFIAEEACSTGCGKCNVVTGYKRIEKQLNNPKI